MGAALNLCNQGGKSFVVQKVRQGLDNVTQLSSFCPGYFEPCFRKYFYLHLFWKVGIDIFSEWQCWICLVINYCIFGMSSGCKSHYFGNHNEVHNDFFLFNLFSFVICTVPWMFNQSENFESFSDWLWMLFFLIFFSMSIYLATPLKLLINVT